MKQKFIAIILLVGYFTASGQKNIDGLVKSERGFAAYALSHGVKPAFLLFADTTGIMYDRGKIVNAHKLWNSRDSSPVILKWRPDYVEIAGSHDFGYTTGPWTLQFSKEDTAIKAHGRFITVWHMNNNGEWKFLVDLGVSNVQVSSDTVLRKIEITNPSIEPGTLPTLLEAENNFIAATRQSLKDAYLKYISPQSILNRNNIRPARTNDEVRSLLDSLPPQIEFTTEGSGIASSGDLGFVYGTTMINGKSDGFLHIWRKEKQGWKIALEVLHP